MTPDAHFAKLFPRLSRKTIQTAGFQTTPYPSRKISMTPELVRERFSQALTDWHKAYSHAKGVAYSALIVLLVQFVCVSMEFVWIDYAEYNGIFWLAIASACLGVYGTVTTLKLRQARKEIQRLIDLTVEEQNQTSS